MLRRILGWALALLIIGVVLYLLFRPDRQGTEGTDQVTLPPEVERVIPPEWSVKQNQPCDFDGDGEQETLVVYAYNRTDVRPPASQDDSVEPRGPIGGVIYDAQVSPPGAETSNESPYRPTSLFPYRLLPDVYPGKGQGYLGETTVKVVLYPPSQPEKCQAQEINILGYSDSPLPTRFSVFRWVDKATGYQDAHFVGNAQVNVPNLGDARQPVIQVTTYNRLNDRSLLCEVNSYFRPNSPMTVTFTENPAAFTIDFCFDAPVEPVYPEGVVVAVLRGGNASAAADKTPTPGPPANSYLLNNTIVPPGLDLRGNQAPYRILSLTNRAAVAPEPGDQCTSSELGADAAGWWCGRGTSVVDTEIVVSDQIRRATWKLLTITPMDANADIRWRVAEVTLQ